jgi:serine/threonine-protein kinase
MQSGPLSAACLSPGARVGPWRIVDLRGQGAFGTVYLAEGVVPGASGTVALKLAHFARDERFSREVELLSRIHHPAVPRLIGHGEWMSPSGAPHPFLAMEWVEGIPLYEWAQAFSPSSRQVLRLLASLARALEATHAAGGLHRDVKGDNVLVRLEDGQVFLTDFGSGNYPGAAMLTWQVFPPGTPPYRSPEAYRFALNIREAPVKTYVPTAADDLFALGVTAYKLVTGQYPPSPQPLDARFHVWKTDGAGPQPARYLNPRCSVELSALISRMLSRQPEARGSARELAEALERAARVAGRKANAPLTRVDTEDEARWDWMPWLVAAGLAGASVLGARWVMSIPRGHETAEVMEARDAGSVAVGDTASPVSVTSAHAPSAGTSIALDMPSKPLPRQSRPDANGRCPRDVEVSINGGCWMKLDVKLASCKDGYIYKGGCYAPAYPPPRPATSSPPESRDGGSNPVSP